MMTEAAELLVERGETEIKDVVWGRTGSEIQNNIRQNYWAQIPRRIEEDGETNFPLD